MGPKFYNPFPYQGVLGLNFLKQKGNLVYGAECNYTNMKGMQGMSKNLVAGFGLAYEKYDPVLTREENKVNPYSLTNGKYSETAIKYTAKSFSLMPADITLTHWCKGKTIFGTGIPGGLSAMAQLQIKQDPMAAMTGKDKKNIEGKIMYSWKFEDPTFKKVQPMPGQMAPEDPLAKTVKVCLDTNRTVATCIDSKITGTPLNVSSKVSYNIPKDELKMGISLSMG